MADIKRKGYGQVEANHLAGIVTGQIYAQLPAHVRTGTTGAATIDQLEQGQFAKYDYANQEVNFGSTDNEFLLVYNEEKLYDEKYQSHKDFVYKRTDFTDNKMYPRLIRTYVGDIITTNMITNANTSNTAEVTIGTDSTLVDGAYLAPSTSTGILGIEQSKPESGMVWKVVKVYTMSDGQPGVKIQRIQ